MNTRKNTSKKELFSNNIESGFLEIIKPQVANMFKKLSKMSPDLEKEWKDLFAKNVILYIDGFLDEMSEELEIPYNKDIRIEKLKNYIENIENK
ncbi:hypothetical protein N5U17_04320 [Aliarcobacter butzleri]|uniref:Uncharacterized protein n=1 Tax=Aliarcobacter butzleri L348 TaxID=1447256 RepID=A0A0G9K7S9_9BACT|nr:hypothetical protein [Aliarcobacter butzleri]KLE01830.1 hypothetical protein AA20_02080 [Aliarcobacter butzleri L348]MCG3655369.1 hypothetical protein [Aliarcobacter butzleri]MCG3685897.1 hypothetical protein [Aliarcobacter butzleri]MCT7555567.1 hypothetical protein [Aliarcobacter butzleri]MCT7591495.1 hypothetical protein [Aliarcobacter butzleri]